MKPILTKLITGALGPLYGKKRFQSLFHFLYFQSLRGLNFQNNDFETNGEAWLLDRLSRKLPANRPIVALDVGANVGNYASLLLTNWSHLDVTLYCFEPVRGNRNLLEERMKEFGSRVRCLPFGLGNAPSEVPMYSNDTSSPLASMYPRDLNYVHITMQVLEEKVRIDTLEAFCNEAQIGHIDFMKVDVEGNEVAVFEGALPLLRKRAIDVIQFEFGGTSIDSRTYLKDVFNLLHADYRIYRLLQNGVYEYVAYSPTWEILSLANYLAVSRSSTIVLQGLS
jgi:FkbM family methyltransferase